MSSPFLMPFLEKNAVFPHDEKGQNPHFENVYLFRRRRFPPLVNILAERKRENKYFIEKLRRDRLKIFARIP